MRSAVETRYAGHLFRSRLEARWAALFDQLEWEWTYEPFDGNGYLPDFLIHGPHPLLVEVKPEVNLSDLEAHIPKVEAGVSGIWAHDVIIVGASPRFDNDEWCDIGGVLGEWIDAGWTGWTPGWDWGKAIWNSCGECRVAAVHHEYQSFRCRPCNHYDNNAYAVSPTFDLRELWGVAHERTRWTP